MAILDGIKERIRGKKKKDPVASGLDVFLKIDGIDGESEDKAHAKEMRVLDYLVAAYNVGLSSTGRGGGKVEFDDATFVIEIDTSLIGSLTACTSGKHIKSAVLTVRKAGGGQQDYIKWTFSDFIVSLVRVLDPGYYGSLLCCIGINFSKVEFEYKEQKPDGTLGAPVNATFDLKAKK
jgi:type VI secretion system secreted protein Hcp